MFSQLKEMLGPELGKARVYGETFAEADEEEKTIMLDLFVKVLADMTEEKAMGTTRIPVKKFLQLANQ